MIKLWYSIDPDQFRNQISEKIGGATVLSSTSPYSVPNAVSTYSNDGKYFFEAKYIGPEEPVQVQSHGGYNYAIGKNTGRLFKLILQSDPALAPDAVVEKFKGALTQLNSGSPTFAANVDVVRSILDVNKNRFKFLQPTSKIE